MMLDPFVCLTVALGLMCGVAIGSDANSWVFFGLKCATGASLAWTVITLVDALAKCGV